MKQSEQNSTLRELLAVSEEIRRSGQGLSTARRRWYRTSSTWLTREHDTSSDTEPGARRHHDAHHETDASTQLSPDPLRPLARALRIGHRSASTPAGESLTNFSRRLLQREKLLKMGYDHDAPAWKRSRRSRSDPATLGESAPYRCTSARPGTCCYQCLTAYRMTPCHCSPALAAPGTP